MRDQEELIVGLDIGTTKICAVVGEVTNEGIHIIGTGTHPSVGLRKGVIVNIESTVDSIKKAIEDAEIMAGCEISNVYAGIAGAHMQGFNSHGIIAIKGSEITQSDVQRVIEAARAVAIPMDREVIHVLPQEFIVDDQPGIQNPVGMAGVRLEVKIHIVTGAVTAVQNIVRCANRASLEINDIVLESLASGESVLMPEEKELGVALIDIGGGTTDMAIFSGKNIKHTSVIPLGGTNLTNDLAYGLRTSLTDAESIKTKHGSCIRNKVSPDDMVDISGVGGSHRGRQVPRAVLCEIIEPRMEELFALVNREVYRAGMERLIVSGYVMTGGASLLDGVAEFGEMLMEQPIRIGKPKGIKGLTDVVNNPMYATGVGLILHGASKKRKPRKFRSKDKNIFSRILQRMKGWFKEAI
ncbi:MAG: Cell division protein ftsA [Candidatus Magnetoglobus multicellularis str. Araruama]|uniref:Cell division protein FtsA n=1 Tax=Candidatus Magnetoglobus multicellularis str. Araruama TaxID=890399 RepID=A0A1V1PCQ0_9BACT|nr:MAG: Cell division protein ftsA [Candidatus Magnetoglobus multicellularis str. Araruama]